jgi:hypothetical protein
MPTRENSLYRERGGEREGTNSLSLLPLIFPSWAKGNEGGKGKGNVNSPLPPSLPRRHYKEV